MKKTTTKTKNKDKFHYKPSKTFWISTVALLVFLTATHPTPLLAAFVNGMWALVFVFDVQREKEKQVLRGDKHGE